MLLWAEDESRWIQDDVLFHALHMLDQFLTRP